MLRFFCVDAISVELRFRGTLERNELERKAPISCHNFNFEKVIKFARGTEIALVRLELSSHQGKESLLKTALGAIFKSLNHNHTDLCIEYTIHKYVPSPVLLQALHLATVDCSLPCPNR